MATTYTADGFAADLARTVRDGGVFAVSRVYTITAAFATNDIIQMIKVAKGTRVLDVLVECPALDSSTGVVWSLGDGDTVGQYILSSTAGRSSTAGLVRANSITGLSKLYAADDTIDFKVTTQASGTAVTTGTIRVTALMRMEQ